jgi:hypothetical protein
MTDHAQQCEQLLHDTRLRLVKAGSLKRLAQRTGLPRNTLFNIRDGHTASPAARDIDTNPQGAG